MFLNSTGVEFKNLLRSHGMNFLFVVVCDALLIALAKFETLFLLADHIFYLQARDI